MEELSGSVVDDVSMESICSELEKQMEPSLLNNMQLYLECNDEELNFAPSEKQLPKTAVQLNITFSSRPVEETVNNKYSCYQCMLKFKQETAYRKHSFICHGNTKPFICHLCPYRCASIKLLKKHCIHKHNEEFSFENTKHIYMGNEYICAKCSFSTTSENLLQGHFEEFHDEKAFLCNHCGFSCEQRQVYELHMKNHEDIGYICEMCGKTCSTFEVLKRHQIIHVKLRPYECPFPECAKSFKIKGSLTDHIKIVHNKKPKYKQYVKHKADCESTPIDKLSGNYKASNNLSYETTDNSLHKSQQSLPYKTKMSSNSKETPLISSSETFDDVQQNFNCKNQIYMPHPEDQGVKRTVKERMKYDCPWKNCAKSFRDNYNLKNHYATHTKEKQKKCPKCDFMYVQRASLNFHMKKIHIDDGC